MELLTKKVTILIMVLLPCFSQTLGQNVTADDSKGKAMTYFHSTQTSDYRISTYEATVEEAKNDCKNLANSRQNFQLIIIENEVENTVVRSQLQKLGIQSVWTAGKRTENDTTWTRSDLSDELSFMKFSDFDFNEKTTSNPRNRRALARKPMDSLPYPLSIASANLTSTPKCRSLPSECKPLTCNVTLPECSINTPNCTTNSEPECIATRPNCTARCENCTVAVPPQCYAQPQNCTVKTPTNCRLKPKNCTVTTLPCSVTRPACVAFPLPCKNVTIPAPCTTREPCIRNNSCVGEDCKCPIAICQVNATICPQPETHCKPPIVNCPDPVVDCNENPEVECDPPEVDCPEPVVICTEAQVICSSPIVNCPAVVTTCLPPNVTCPAPELDCPDPIVKCDEPEGGCEFISTPGPCEDETTTTIEKPCTECGCVAITKANNYKWSIEKCNLKRRFICEAPK